MSKVYKSEGRGSVDQCLSPSLRAEEPDLQSTLDERREMSPVNCSLTATHFEDLSKGVPGEIIKAKCVLKCVSYKQNFMFLLKQSFQIILSFLRMVAGALAWWCRPIIPTIWSSEAGG